MSDAGIRKSEQKQAVILLPDNHFKENRIRKLLQDKKYLVTCFQCYMEAKDYCTLNTVQLACIVLSMNSDQKDWVNPKLDTRGGLFTGHSWAWEVIAPITKQSSMENLKIHILFSQDFQRDIEKFMADITMEQRAFFEKYVILTIYSEDNDFI